MGETKRDCMFFKSETKRGCTALKMLYCKKEECKFYKPRVKEAKK